MVFAKVDEILDFIKDTGNSDDICFSEQCRVDMTCYVLNRIKPCYVVSNRGVARVGQVTFEKQQLETDVSALVYEAIHRVSRNKRPVPKPLITPAPACDTSVFNFPTLLGRLFNGMNFATMTDVTLELHCCGKLIPMIDDRWQNPYTIVPHTAGMFTFWPNPLPAEKIGVQRIFEFELKAECAEFEPLYHFFEMPVTSEAQRHSAFSMGRTVKLPDLYMFPPTEEEEELF
jgi:competence protein ComFB